MAEQVSTVWSDYTEDYGNDEFLEQEIAILRQLRTRCLENITSSEKRQSRSALAFADQCHRIRRYSRIVIGGEPPTREFKYRP